MCSWQPSLRSRWAAASCTGSELSEGVCTSVPRQMMVKQPHREGSGPAGRGVGSERLAGSCGCGVGQERGRPSEGLKPQPHGARVLTSSGITAEEELINAPLAYGVS